MQIFCFLLNIKSFPSDTTHYSNNDNYRIEDIFNFNDVFFLEHLLQTFWQTQAYWYSSRQTLGLTRRTFGHYSIIKDQLQILLRDLKSNKPLSETFANATYLDQTQAYIFIPLSDYFF